MRDDAFHIPSLLLPPVFPMSTPLLKLLSIRDLLTLEQLSMRLILLLLSVSLFPRIAAAQNDQGGCKDPEFFNRMPGHYLERCEESPFEMRRFPVGPLTASGAKLVEVEGAW